jgi:hypothetical protein
LGQSLQGPMTDQQTHEMQHGESVSQSASTSPYGNYNVCCHYCRNSFMCSRAYSSYAKPYYRNGAQYHPVNSNCSQQPPAQPTKPYYAGWYSPAYPSSTQQPLVQSTESYYEGWYNPAYPSSTHERPV